MAVHVESNLSRVQDLAVAGCDIVEGDISDLASMQRALESVKAVWSSPHLDRTRGIT